MENDDTNSAIKIYLNDISPPWMDHIMSHIMYHITLVYLQTSMAVGLRIDQFRIFWLVTDIHLFFHKNQSYPKKIGITIFQK